MKRHPLTGAIAPTIPHNDPGDLLPGGGGHPPSPAPRSGHDARIECEFCGCQLDRAGNVLKRGDGARKYLDLEDDLKRCRAKVDKLTEQNAELSRQLEARTEPANRGGILDDL